MDNCLTQMVPCCKWLQVLWCYTPRYQDQLMKTIHVYIPTFSSQHWIYMFRSLLRKALFFDIKIHHRTPSLCRSAGGSIPRSPGPCPWKKLRNPASHWFSRFFVQILWRICGETKDEKPCNQIKIYSATHSYSSVWFDVSLLSSLNSLCTEPWLGVQPELHAGTIWCPIPISQTSLNIQVVRHIVPSKIPFKGCTCFINLNNK